MVGIGRRIEKRIRRGRGKDRRRNGRRGEHGKVCFAPDGFSVRDCEMDFRVGGTYRLCMRGFGGDHWVHGVYREIVKPERIVWTGTLENEGTETVTTITFEE